MRREKGKPNLFAFVPIGCGLVAVGIATDSWGLMGGGVLFIIVGAVSVVRAKRGNGNGGREDTRTEE